MEKTLTDCAQELGAITKAEVGIAWIGDTERDLKLLTYLETNAHEVWGPMQPHLEPPLSGRVLIMVMLARTGEARSIRLYELSDADTTRWQSLGRSSTSFGELADSVVN